MKAIITNSKLGKTIIFNNVLDEGYTFGSYYGFYYSYKLKVLAEENLNTIPNIYNALNFPIEKIEIYDNIKDPETNEISEKCVRSIEDMHSILNIDMKIEYVSSRSSTSYYKPTTENEPKSIIDILFM